MNRPTVLIGIVVALLFATAFTACNLTGNVSDTQQQDIAYACASIAAAEDVLAAAPADKIAPYRARIVAAIKIKQPVCNVKPEPKNLTDAGYKALMGAATDFIAIRAAVAK